MTIGTSETIHEVKMAQGHVFAELLKRGVLPYRTANGGIGVSTAMGNRLELFTVAATETGDDGEFHFAVTDFQPHPQLFFLCVELTDGEISRVWVFPSISFFVYAEPVEEEGLVSLSLDAMRSDSFAESLREYVSFFRGRWDPIVQFDYFRQYMPPMDAPGFPRAWEDFEDILMLMELSEARDWNREAGTPFEPPDPSPDYGQPLIELTPKAQQDLDRIPEDDRDEVQEGIRSLADNPHPSGSIGLTGSPGNYRVRKFL